MSLKERLSLIENKPYQPIYSAKIAYKKPKKLDDIRPKTTRPKTTSSTRIQSSRVLSSITSSRTGLVQSRAPSKSTQIGDDDSESVNLSLLSLESEEYVVNRDKYGKFKYFSYFERYMNRRAAVKIPAYLMPKLDSEEILEPTIFDLLDPDESQNLYSLYEITIARPPRLRSNSVHGERVFKHPLTVITRRNSLNMFPINQKTTQIEKTSEQIPKNKTVRESLLDEDVDTGFNVRGIKAPQVYGLGFKREIKTASPEKRTKLAKRPYSHVESKLAAYLAYNRPSREHKNQAVDSKNAIVTHDVYTKDFVVYKKPVDPDPNADKPKPTLADCYLKISGELEDRIKKDLKVNRGPIYFVQLTQENVNAHDGAKVTAAKKYSYIFEWLKGMDEKNCAHFYENPFFLDKSCVTDDLSTSEIRPTNEAKFIGYRASTRFKIDPFNNPTTHTLIDKLPVKHRSNLNPMGYYETQEKQTLACSKDYKSMLRFNTGFLLRPTRDIRPTANNIDPEAVRNKLRKQKELNDILFARTQLNLFIL